MWNLVLSLPMICNPCIVKHWNHKMSAIRKELPSGQAVPP